MITPEQITAIFTGLAALLGAVIVAYGTVHIQIVKANVDARVAALQSEVSSLRVQLITETELRRMSDAAKDATIANLQKIIADLQTQRREDAITIQGLVQQVSALQIALATKTAQAEESKPVT